MNRSIQSIAVLACIIGLLCGIGCQSAAVNRTVGTGAGPDGDQVQVERVPLTGGKGYAKARLYDFADIFGFSLLFGIGVDINARATQLFQIGGGIYESRRLGFIGRFCGWWRESRTEGGVTVAYGQRLTRSEMEGPIKKYFPNDFYPRPETLNLPGAKDRTADEIGATVFAAFFGVDAFVRPVEFIDFLCGWFKVDFKDDDYELKLKSEAR